MTFNLIDYTSFDIDVFDGLDWMVWIGFISWDG